MKTPESLPAAPVEAAQPSDEQIHKLWVQHGPNARGGFIIKFARALLAAFGPPGVPLGVTEEPGQQGHLTALRGKVTDAADTDLIDKLRGALADIANADDLTAAGLRKKALRIYDETAGSGSD